MVTALGITVEGKKLILGLREGDTENSEIVKDLLRNLIERGFSTEHPYLFVIDGGKAIKRVILKVFGNKTPRSETLSRISMTSITASSAGVGKGFMVTLTTTQPWPSTKCWSTGWDRLITKSCGHFRRQNLKH